MPLTLSATNLLDSSIISKFIFNVDDVTTGSLLTPQQRTAFELIADAASAQVQKFCDFLFKQGTYTEVWDGGFADEIIPREVPITAITSIKFAGNGDFASVTPLDSAAYCIGSRGLVINFRDGLLTPRGRGMVQVVYQAGYSPIPPDIQLATLRQLQYLYKQIGKGDAMLGLKSISKMNESQTKDDTLGRSGLIVEVEGMLAPYRRFETSSSIMFTRVA